MTATVWAPVAVRLCPAARAVRTVEEATTLEPSFLVSGSVGDTESDICPFDPVSAAIRVDPTGDEAEDLALPDEDVS